MAKYKAPQGLIERLFSLFTGQTYEGISEFLGMGRATVGGWKTGASVPKLSELEKICELTRVNWQWLLTGQTENIEAITYAYFPIYHSKGEIINDTLYDEARHISGCALWMDNGLMSDFDDKAIHAVAALWRGAITEGAPDPMAKTRGHIEQPDEFGTIAFCQKTMVPHDFLSKTTAIIGKMRNDYLKPKFIPYQGDDFESFSRNIRPFNGLVPANQLVAKNEASFPIRGRAAADDSGGSRVPDTDETEDILSLPESLVFVPVQGDSMSPVVLDGQYAVIDQNREGFEVDGGIYVISVQEPDAADDQKEPMIGTFVKRVYQGDGIYYFTSVNEYSPFSALIRHCRMWPVIGVWFAGKGRVPKDFQ